MKVKLWEDINSKNTINPKLFSEEAEAKSRKLADDNNRNRRINKRTQLRKFYDEVLRLDAEAKAKPDDWVFILPQVHMLTAKAAYAKGRNLVSDNFLEFIKSGVEQIEEHKDLRIFAMLFEAMMGFYRMHVPSN